MPYRISHWEYSKVLFRGQKNIQSVQIRSFFWSVFPEFGLNAERYGVFSPNVGKYGPEKTPYLDTFQAVLIDIFIENAYNRDTLTNIVTEVNKYVFATKIKLWKKLEYTFQ